jgi:hypothetical protein
MHVCPAFAHFPQSTRLTVISMLTVLSMYTGLKKIMHGLRNSLMDPITHNLLICSIQSYVVPTPSNPRPNFFFNIPHSVHYNSYITIQANKFTRFYYNHINITTHKLLQVSGLNGPSSGSKQLCKTVT